MAKRKIAAAHDGQRVAARGQVLEFVAPLAAGIGRAAGRAQLRRRQRHLGAAQGAAVIGGGDAAADHRTAR
jgi:hypothetical protein